MCIPVVPGMSIPGVLIMLFINGITGRFGSYSKRQAFTLLELAMDSKFRINGPSVSILSKTNNDTTIMLIISIMNLKNSLVANSKAFLFKAEKKPKDALFFKALISFFKV